MPPDLPPGMQWLRSLPEGRAWLADLHRLVDECADRWSLRLGTPYPTSTVSLVMPASRADGAPAVLKVQFPHRESRGEAAALARWGGRGAVTLLDHDPQRGALLLERAEPGTPLSTEGPDTALAVLAAIVRQLSVEPGDDVTTLTEESAHWADGLPRQWRESGRPFGRRMLDAALGLLAALPSGDTGPPVLLHQDLHGDNVLAAARRPWLAIDPKPLAGDPAFAAAPIVRSAELGHSAADVRHRLDRMVDELGLPRERAHGWAFVQTLAWSFEGGRVLERNLQVATWLFEGRPPGW